MSIEGRIAIDVGFSDSTTSSGVQSLKRIALTSTDAYSTGKVAVVTGTAGTASAGVAIAPTVYKDSSGVAVSFSSVCRFAFAATGSPCRLSNDYITIESAGGRVAASEMASGVDDFTVATTAGTASYTLVLYGV